ncbi:MAG: MoaD/ThiS family protein [Planctomycetes bacterium]|nr:MoaD/ThiS family protein [Planctomycetota bacterium]
MKITINYFGQLREAANTNFETCDCPEGTTIDEVLGNAAMLHGGKFKKIVLDDNDNPRGSVVVLLNGQSIDRENLPVLKDNDEINLFTAIAGG